MAELSEGRHRRQGGGAARDPGRVLRRAARGQSRHQRVRARVVPPDPGGARLRAGVRIRPRRRGVLRLGADHRWRGPVAAVPDAGGGLGRFRRRLPALRCGGSRSGCCWPATAWCRPCSTGCSSTSGSGPSSGSTTTYSFVPGLGTLANLHRFILFDLTTSMGFDLTRAVTCAVLILVLGRPVLAALRRASRRAAFEPQIDFDRGAGLTGWNRSSEDRLAPAVRHRDRLRPRPR